MSPYFRPQTAHGYALDEVASALQKAIRRSRVEEAMWWAVELNLSGMGAYAWRRLMVIANEDIGMASPETVVLVASLYAISVELKKAQPGPAAEKAEREWESEPLMHAVIALAKAPKNRELADAYSTICLRMKGGQRLEVDDAYLDLHTARGRAMGRREDHFQKVGRVVFPAIEIDGDKWGKAFQAERPRDRDEVEEDVAATA